MQHPVANFVPIPTEKISEALERCAVPGFTGKVTGYLRILPTAAHEVEFTFETETTLAIRRHEETEAPVVTNARVAKVRRVLMENADRFKIGTPLSRIFATFDNGELRRFEVTEVSE
jgi:hypothetical protein